MLTLTPVIDFPATNVGYEWVRFRPTGNWVALDGTFEHSDAILLIAMLGSYNGCGDGTLATVAARLETVEDCVLPGGLKIQTGQGTIWPSCCCGLESWREWFDVLTTEVSPWLGHDPTPHVEVEGDRVTVWEDAETDSRYLTSSKAELESALLKTKADLAAYAAGFHEWLRLNLPDRRKIAAQFRDHFEID